MMSLMEEHVRDQSLFACLLREALRCVCSAGVDSNPDFPGSQALCSHSRAKHLLAACAHELEAALGKGFCNFGSGLTAPNSSWSRFQRGFGLHGLRKLFCVKDVKKAHFKNKS